jgi:acetolactate synthase-1/2/3 large subunit
MGLRSMQARSTRRQRFSETRNGPWSYLTIVHIDIDADELGRITEPTVGIHADLADALPLLLEALGEIAPRTDWFDRIVTRRAHFDGRYAADLPDQMAWLAAIRAELPRDGIFVDELTQNGYVSRFAFPTYEARTFISTGYQGTLGYGYATALGAAHARRDVPVVNITGDGGALFTISELATAVHHQIPLTTVVFTDNAFGNVKRIQQDNYGERFIASDLTSPDFVKLADAFGAQGLRATTPEELRLRLRDGIAAEGPTLIEVPVGVVNSPWPFVLMPKVRGAS